MSNTSSFPQQNGLMFKPRRHIHRRVIAMEKRLTVPDSNEQQDVATKQHMRPSRPGSMATAMPVRLGKPEGRQLMVPKVARSRQTKRRLIRRILAAIGMLFLVSFLIIINLIH